ncbi:hypothetical protein SAMN05216276_11203 [Streptosporangium subroseum]|uniref:Uncharacterized protein n=1 Tax=Streptosporangium subroseum TaxID=106412 RepID=A0A239PC02_9ACTN|nr:hypothetical protein [Streptosporangium subroseum]SNT64473.1 hypothetical protein SAMN05216276_11203 [Streptosporangium subroseum]
MVREVSLRSSSKRVWRRWSVLVPGVALTLVAGFYLANRGDPGQVNRSITTPVEQEGTSNMKIIEKNQVIDVTTFDQKDSPLWPLIVELRKAELKRDRMVTD